MSDKQDKADNLGEIEISSSKVKVKSTVGTVDRIGNALVDLVSPFTETAGAIGDSVRLFRQKNAIHSLIAAKKLADENGVVIKPVHPKFLIQWLESASLEEKDNNDLTDLWAGLLVAEATKSMPAHFYFQRILREITHHHREFLVKICRIDTAGDTIDLSSVHSAAIDFERRLEKLNAENRHYESIETKEIDDLFSSLKLPGIAIDKVFLKSYPGGRSNIPTDIEQVFQFEFPQKYIKNLVIDHLIQLGILRRSEIGIFGGGSRFFDVNVGEDKRRYRIEFSFWFLTQLGVDFIAGCYGQPNANSPKSSGDV